MIIDWQALAEGLVMALNWKILLLSFIGVLFGTILGMIPGLTGSVGMAIMLPLTFVMEPFAVMCLLLGIWAGGVYGGSVTAILINTPGTPAAVCTALDGYPLNQQGRGLHALFAAMFSSVTGGLIGIFVLILSVNTFGKIVLKFGAPEMFMVVFLALSIITTIRPESPAKTIFAGFIGILLGTIGIATTGLRRGTLGIPYLLDGIPFIPALIGMFALSEALIIAEKKFIVDVDVTKKVMGQNIFREMYTAIIDILKRPVVVIKSALIGVFIGALPAAGGSAASVVAYGEAKRSSKNPELFGKGNIEGVIASETSNNASEGGSLATTLLVGIPGSATGAMLLSALYLQGWVAGPRLFIDYRQVMYGVLNIAFFEQFMMILTGLMVVAVTYKIIKIPNAIIAPVLVIMVCVGAFSYRGALFDVGIMVFFGLIAYLMRKLDYPTIALILGLLLGGLVDEQLVRIGQRFAGDFLIIFKRPISLAFAIITILTLVRSFYTDYKQRFVIPISKAKKHVT